MFLLMQQTMIIQKQDSLRSFTGRGDLWQHGTFRIGQIALQRTRRLTLGQGGQGPSVIFISKASSGETGDSRQILTIPKYSQLHITGAKEKFKTKRGTVWYDFMGPWDKASLQSSGANTSGQPRFGRKVLFIDKDHLAMPYYA